MLSEAYELFGCNTADVFVIAVNRGNTNAQCIQFDQTYGVDFPCISGVEGGGTAINTTYGINAYPTYILIAPNHEIVEQDMWPISSVQTFVTYFQNNGLQQAECGAPLTAAFSADDYEVCQGESIQFTDESTGEITSWEWIFEGGTPATSTLQNPIVTYNDGGMWDVTLTVSNLTTSNTFTQMNMIYVFTLPEVSLTAFDTVCFEWPAFELTGGLPEGGVYSGTGVENGWFYPDVAGIGEHIITYVYTDPDGCQNNAVQPVNVTSCVGVAETESGNISIFPNPSSGLVTIETNQPGNFSLSINDVLGETIVETTVSFSNPLVLSNLNPGIYTLLFSDDNQIFVKKLMITKK